MGIRQHQRGIKKGLQHTSKVKARPRTAQKKGTTARVIRVNTSKRSKK